MSGRPQQTFITDIDIINSYNNKRLLVDEMPSSLGIPHVFFTTPMMNFNSSNCLTDGFLSYMYKMHDDWLSALSYAGSSSDSSAVSTTSPFIKLFYNSVQNFPTKDLVSKTKEVGESYYGYKQTFPASEVDSVIGDELSITFNDWQGQPVLHLLNSWFLYHCKVRRGQITPDIKAIDYSYIDFLSTIYYFVTDMDNQTLQYWAKFTGVAPISVPFSVFSSDFSKHDVLEYSVNFSYSFKEDMNPDILIDFNDVTNGCASLINFADDSYDTHADMKTGYMSAKGGETNFSTTEHEKNGSSKPEIVLVARTKANGLISENPKFKLIFNKEN